MKPKALLIPGTILLSAGPLTAGYLLAGSWMILPALLGVGLLFFIARNRSLFQAASVLLLGAFSLAVVGVLMRLSLPLMLVGSVAALASWDLLLFSQSVKGAEKREEISLLEERHYQSLAIALACGVLLSFAATNLALNLPFVVILLLCAVALGGVYFGVRVLIEDQE